MRDMGYRKARAEVLQGVTLEGDNLIITFQVTEGPLTRVAGVEVKGNQIHTEERIRQELRTVINAPYSRSQARADGDRVSALYAREGYVDVRVDFSVVLSDETIPDPKPKPKTDDVQKDPRYADVKKAFDDDPSDTKKQDMAALAKLYRELAARMVAPTGPKLVGDLFLIPMARRQVIGDRLEAVRLVWFGAGNADSEAVTAHVHQSEIACDRLVPKIGEEIAEFRSIGAPRTFYHLIETSFVEQSAHVLDVDWRCVQPGQPMKLGGRYSHYQSPGTHAQPPAIRILRHLA